VKGLLGIIIAAMVVGGAAGGIGAILGCTKMQGREAVTIANEACVLLHGLDPTAEAICATEEELAPIVSRLLAARRLKAAHPTGNVGVSGARPIDPCAVPVTP
jgi:hypothetical protein